MLKYWVDPEESHHEVSLPCRLVADVYDGERITEIQTRNFSKLRPKLARMLPDYPVTVVFPIPRNKRLIWVDPESGRCLRPEITQDRDGVGRFFPNCIISAIICAAPPDGAAGIPRHGRIQAAQRLEPGPEKAALPDGTHPHRVGRGGRAFRPGGFRRPLPAGLPEPFTTADPAKALRVRTDRARKIVYVLYGIGSIQREGKSGNAFLYQNPWKTQSKSNGE